MGAGRSRRIAVVPSSLPRGRRDYRRTTPCPPRHVRLGQGTGPPPRPPAAEPRRPRAHSTVVRPVLCLSFPRSLNPRLLGERLACFPPRPRASIHSCCLHDGLLSCCPPSGRGTSAEGGGGVGVTLEPPMPGSVVVGAVETHPDLADARPPFPEGREPETTDHFFREPLINQET